MSLPWSLLSGALLAGLAGGVHCAGMCGGIVTALSAAPAPAASRGLSPPRRRHALDAVLPHIGRISSYGLFGAAAGGLGSASVLLRDTLPIQAGLFAAANLALAALGLHLIGFLGALPGARLLGASGWRLLRPWFAHFYPARSAGGALALGMAWGWMPCGLVYSVLPLALLSGSAYAGAMIMLLFGIGTLPHLLLAGHVFSRAEARARGHWLRPAFGMLICLMALAGFIRLARPHWIDSFRLISVLCAA